MLRDHLFRKILILLATLAIILLMLATTILVCWQQSCSF